MQKWIQKNLRPVSYTHLDVYKRQALFTALLDREMEEDTLVSSLQELTALLEIHFGQQVIVLIDEYDVPLANATAEQHNIRLQSRAKRADMI